MDMNSAYEQEVKANCPNAEIVDALFHVVAKCGREAIDRVRVDELLAASRRSMTVYVLKDDLKHLWSRRSRSHPVLRFRKGWYRRAVRSRIEPRKRFVRRLKAYLPGIRSHCRNPLHSSVLQGINNRRISRRRLDYNGRFSPKRPEAERDDCEHPQLLHHCSY